MTMEFFVFLILKSIKTCKGLMISSKKVFRTKIREFTSEEPIDVYVFNCNKVMQTMIEQRFVNCTIIEEEWREIAEYKIRNRANASSMIL